MMVDVTLCLLSGFDFVYLWLHHFRHTHSDKMRKLSISRFLWL